MHRRTRYQRAEVFIQGFGAELLVFLLSARKARPAHEERWRLWSGHTVSVSASAMPAEWLGGPNAQTLDRILKVDVGYCKQAARISNPGCRVGAIMPFPAEDKSGRADGVAAARLSRHAPAELRREALHSRPSPARQHGGALFDLRAELLRDAAAGSGRAANTPGARISAGRQSSFNQGKLKVEPRMAAWPMYFTDLKNGWGTFAPTAAFRMQHC